MCHNPGARHDSSLVKLTSAESCQSSNFKTKYKLESQNPLGNPLGTIVPFTLGNNLASLTWEQSGQSHLGIILPVSLGKNCVSHPWEKLY